MDIYEREERERRLNRNLKRQQKRQNQKREEDINRIAERIRENERNGICYPVTTADVPSYCRIYESLYGEPLNKYDLDDAIGVLENPRRSSSKKKNLSRRP